MAYTATQAHVEKKSVFTSVFGFADRFFQALVEANTRASEIRELQDMSDRQLADIGLAREDIVRRVYTKNTVA